MPTIVKANDLTDLFVAFAMANITVPVDDPRVRPLMQGLSRRLFFARMRAGFTARIPVLYCLCRRPTNEIIMMVITVPVMLIPMSQSYHYLDMYSDNRCLPEPVSVRLT